MYRFRMAKRRLARRLCRVAVICAAGLAGAPAIAANYGMPAGFVEKVADINGVKISYRVGGKGPAVVLLHGYAQTSHMWNPLLPPLASSHTVIVPDLRGAGGSDRPPGGYDKKTLAQDIRELVRKLGHDRVAIVGHDIGLMVAYAYAAQFPAEVQKVILMDAFLPGIGNWTDVWLLRDLWHFHFYGETPLRLVAGRERIYFEHFWNDFAADRTRSVSEADRRIYAAAYARADGMRAGFEYFRNLEQDAKDFAGFSQTKLSMPMLVLAGEKASGTFLIEQGHLVATDVRGVIIQGSGHWLIDEAPEETMRHIVAFLDDSDSSANAIEVRLMRRLTPAEIGLRQQSGAGAGTSGVAGIRTVVLSGDPTRPGLYTILLQAPANTRIEAHEHPDERVATVISGTWYFGYGELYEENSLKALPPGSFYTEPANAAHFARTGDTPVVVHISGYGPTGTRYAATQVQ